MKKTFLNHISDESIKKEIERLDSITLEKFELTKKEVKEKYSKEFLQSIKINACTKKVSDLLNTYYSYMDTRSALEYKFNSIINSIDVDTTDSVQARINYEWFAYYTTCKRVSLNALNKDFKSIKALFTRLVNYLAVKDLNAFNELSSKLLDFTIDSTTLNKLHLLIGVVSRDGNVSIKGNAWKELIYLLRSKNENALSVKRLAFHYNNALYSVPVVDIEKAYNLDSSIYETLYCKVYATQVPKEFNIMKEKVIAQFNKRIALYPSGQMTLKENENGQK